MIEVTSLADVDAALAADGAVLVRDSSVRSASDLARVRDELGYTPRPRLEQYAATTDFGDGVSSAPEWGGDREMCLHHEHGSRLLMFACVAPATTGGEMLLGDTRSTLTQLPDELVGPFREHGWVLERNFRPYFGLPWTVAFGLSDPDELAQYASERGMSLEWQADGSLHTSQRRPAIVRHPVTGDECWSNDVGFFSQWSVDEVERKVLLSSFGPNGIPFNTSIGDGTQLTAELWQSIIDAYEAVTLRVALRAGDVLVIDNVLVAHGRAPFTGPREILLAPVA